MLLSYAERSAPGQLYDAGSLMREGMFNGESTVCSDKASLHGDILGHRGLAFSEGPSQHLARCLWCLWHRAI